MAKLLPKKCEIYDGITIKAVVRDPGSRAKIVVMSSDSSIDPVGACVGMRGSQVQAVVAELQGEKVDIINWTEDRGALIVKALAPAEVSLSWMKIAAKSKLWCLTITSRLLLAGVGKMCGWPPVCPDDMNVTEEQEGESAKPSLIVARSVSSMA